MSAVLHNFTPNLAQIAALAALLVTLAAWSTIAASCGARRAVEADLICGVGAASAAFTLLGVAGVPFVNILEGLFILAAACAWRAWKDRIAPLGIASARVFALSIPLILLVAAMAPSQWDEFTHWLPNARFLFAFDRFPVAALETDSVYPGYPHGMAFPIYAASRLTGSFAPSVGGAFNLLLLLSFAAMLAGRIEKRPGWGTSAFVVLALTALSPVFVIKIVFTAYADSATAIALGVAALLGCRMVEALARDRAAARSFAAQFSLTTTALLAFKQVDAALLALLVVALAWIAWRDEDVPFARFAALIGAALIVPTLTYAAWRIHVLGHMPEGEFFFHPLAQWHWGSVWKVIARMALVLSKKGGYVAIALAALAVALVAARRPRTEVERLAVVMAVLFLGYNAFLLVTYLGAFSQFEAERVGSFWRYNLHLGPTAMSFAVLGLVELWRRRGPAWNMAPAGMLAVALVIAVPVALSGKLRFDNRPAKMYVRAVAEEMAGMLGRDTKLTIVDASGDGTYAMMVRYALGGQADALSGDVTLPEPLVREFLAEHPAAPVWVHVPTPAIDAALGVTLAPRASHLLARDGGRWHEIKSWPYPGYAAPWELPD